MKLMSGSTAKMIAAGLLASNLGGCGAAKNTDADTGSTAPTATLSAASATLSSGELATSSGKVVLQSSGSGAFMQCQNSGTDAGSVGPLAIVTANQANSEWSVYFTPTTSFVLTGVQFYANSTGATGQVVAEVFVQGNSYALTSGVVDTSTMTSSYALTTVSFGSGLAVSAGQMYTVVIIGSLAIGSNAYTPTSGSQGVNVKYMTSASCANSAFNYFYNNNGPVSGEMLDIHMMTTAYPTDGPTAAMTGDSGTAGSTWTMSSFNPSENPNGGTGTITYDVGASDTNSATYSSSGLSKAQVKALSNLTGRYLFVKAHLTSSGFNSASIGDITVEY